MLSSYSKTAFMSDFLKNARALNRQRFLRDASSAPGVEVIYEGRRCLNFSSNNYLGLAHHPALIERTVAFTKAFGTGSTASRLVCGSYSYHSQVESKIAHLMGTEAALIFGSGYQANATVVPALTDRFSALLADKWIHHSLVTGARQSDCTLIRYPHQDLLHLERLLIQERKKGNHRLMIVSESIFSMDGDQADLDALIALAERFDALLYIDDAHATGIMGMNGMGLTAGRAGIDVRLGSFGKAAGAYGAFIACSQEMKEYLIHTCGGVIYSTAVPPALVGAMDAALDLIPYLDEERGQLAANVKMLWNALDELGLGGDRGRKGISPIIPIIVGDEAKTLALSHLLEQQGMLVVAIRPPTVPQGTSRLRIALSSLHTQEHMNRLIEALRAAKEVFSIN